jgi:transcriptional regulator with XRE-family HTH domain
MQRFGPLLANCIESAGFTFNGFAKKVGAGSSTISQISTSKRTPPLDQIDHWADVLGLKGEKRAEFLEIACLEHCPEPIRAEYQRLKTQVQKLEARMTKIEESRR